MQVQKTAGHSTKKPAEQQRFQRWPRVQNIAKPAVATGRHISLRPENPDETAASRCRGCNAYQFKPMGLWNL